MQLNPWNLTIQLLDMSFERNIFIEWYKLKKKLEILSTEIFKNVHISLTLNNKVILKPKSKYYIEVQYK